MPGLISRLFSCISNIFTTKSIPKTAPPRKDQPYVTANVRALRAKATASATEMKTLFGSSQAAFRSNNKKKAHDLSVKGKAAQQTMHELNGKARGLILKNQHPSTHKFNGILDLHGLFLEEAKTEAEKFLDLQGRKMKSTSCEIVTGAGHHSRKHDQPVLRPAIVKLLEERGIEFEFEHGDGAVICYFRET